MYIFKCRECEKRCYSDSSLETHLNPYCPYCGGEIYDTEIVKNGVIENCDRCLLCGTYIPEGRMVCKACEENPFRTHEQKGGGI